MIVIIASLSKAIIMYIADNLIIFNVVYILNVLNQFVYFTSYHVNDYLRHQVYTQSIGFFNIDINLASSEPSFAT